MILQSIEETCVPIPCLQVYSRGTKVEKMLTLAPARYTAGFCMVAKVIQWCIKTTVKQTRSTCITPEQSTFYGSPARKCQNIIFQNVIYFYQKKFRIEKY